MARTKHTAIKSTGDERNRMDDPVSNDDDSSDLEKKSTRDKRKQRDEFSEDERDCIQVRRNTDYDGPPIWEGIWEKNLPELTQWADPMPPVKLRLALCSSNTGY